MIFKHAVIFSFLVTVNICLFGQTRSKVSAAKPTLEETVNWIVEKLSSTTTREVNSLSVGVLSTDNSDFKFDKGKQLIILEQDFNIINNQGQITTFYYTVSIPITKIDKVEYAEDFKNVNTKELEKNTYLQINTIENLISKVNNKTNETTYSNSLKLSIDFNREENLQHRYKKAFNNLMSYFPKKKEVF